jgi:hypothetical protein
MEEKPLREPISRPGEPTLAAPGSARKIRVLMERAARKEPLFHPLDGIRRRTGSTAGNAIAGTTTGNAVAEEPSAGPASGSETKSA